MKRELADGNSRVDVRAIRCDDLPICATVFKDSLNGVRAALGIAPGEFPGVEHDFAHLLCHDPDGAFVAEDDDGEVVGFALAARREELWVLCDLFVAPLAQGAGVGKLLLTKAVGYGKGLPAGIICSTADPRAIRSYARLPGFQVHPTLIARGTNDHSRVGNTDGVREGTTTDLDFAAQLDRRLRRGAHGADLEHLIANGSALLVVDERGYAVAGESGPKIVAAVDDDAGAALLRACLLHCEDGADIMIPWIGAAHQWALQVALETGMTLSPGGPLLTRNNPAATSDYLPGSALS
jgi:GNAT superfamily N-acetyltransferase